MLPPPPAQQQEHAPGCDSDQEQYLWREDGLEDGNPGREGRISVGVDDAYDGEVHVDEQVLREQVLDDTVKRPGEEARKEKTDGEGESVDLSRGEAPAELETYGTYEERAQTPPAQARGHLPDLLGVCAYPAVRQVEQHSGGEQDKQERSSPTNPLL
ncbi:MAG: hypothetical protein LC740_16880, partial [Actinobacteria bacterium]|nr:hypothetical protein [Actinomycetota bacterium]